MVTRRRAILVDDKRERYDAILDAAERVLLRSPDRSASMAAIADEAGLAKGTIYLYVASKEALLQALHERSLDAFFGALIALLETAEHGSVTIDDVSPLTQRYLLDSPLFAPRASRCFSMLEQNVPDPSAATFGARTADGLRRVGAGLERHFPKLEPGDGAALLQYSYALILGLRQTAARDAAPSASRRATPTSDERARSARSYARDVDRGLRMLWDAMLRDDAKRSAPP